MIWDQNKSDRSGLCFCDINSFFSVVFEAESWEAKLHPLVYNWLDEDNATASTKILMLTIVATLVEVCTLNSVKQKKLLKLFLRIDGILDCYQLIQMLSAHCWSNFSDIEDNWIWQLQEKARAKSSMLHVVLFYAQFICSNSNVYLYITMFIYTYFLVHWGTRQSPNGRLLLGAATYMLNRKLHTIRSCHLDAAPFST
jgi:hypothetical protein